MPSHHNSHPRRILQAIAAFKFLKAVALIAAGCAALGILNPTRSAEAQAWLERLALTPGHQLITAWAERAVVLLSATGPRRLRELAIGAFLYAGLFFVEGVGLARARRWAEYLTVVATSSYLPLEAWALWRHPTLAPAVTIVLNAAVVGYLLFQLRVGRLALAQSAGPPFRE